MILYLLYHVLKLDMNGANPFVCCYEISGAALSKCEVFSNISSGIFSSALKTMIFTIFRTTFAKDLKWYLS